MALILAGIVAAATLALSFIIAAANSMSDAPSVQSSPVAPVFVTGMVIAGLIAGSHWIHIGW